MSDYFGLDDLQSVLRQMEARERAVVACRAVLRALPALVEEPKEPLAPNKRRLLLACFRGTAIAWNFALDGFEAKDAGYAARDLVALQSRFESQLVARVCDATQSLVDSISDRSISDSFDAVMDASVAADLYAAPKARRELIAAAAHDIRALADEVADRPVLLSPLWGTSRVPAWNAAAWRLTAFQLAAAKESWEPWVNWYGHIVGGSHGLRPSVTAALRVAKLAEGDWSHPKAANQKLSSAIGDLQKWAWARALDDTDETDAPPVGVSEDQLRFTPSIQSSDATVALRAGMSAEYANIRKHVRSLKKLVVQWVDEDCHPDWRGLKTDISRLDRHLPADMTVAVSQVAVLWAAGVAVAEYLDQDRQLRTDPHSGNAPALPVGIRNSLTTFVQIFPAWLLEFPTAAKREENANAFGDALQRLHASKRVIGHVRAANVLRKEDLLLVEELLKSAERNGHQAAKAKFWTFATVKRVIFAGSRILARAAATQVAGDYAESSVLLKRLTELMLDGEAAVTEFVSQLPATSREAVLAIIERLKEG